MDNEWKNMLLSLGFVLLLGVIILAFSGVFYDADLISFNDSSEEYFEDYSDEYYENYYENYSLNPMPVKYNIKNKEDCGAPTILQIHQAFNIIESETDGVVSFEEVDNEEYISIKCFDRYDESVQEIASGYTYAETFPSYYVDKNGVFFPYSEINLFKVSKFSHYGRCKDYPVTIIAQILYSFDLEERDSDILGEYVGFCPDDDDDGIIDEWIIEELKAMYFFDDIEFFD